MTSHRSQYYGWTSIALHWIVAGLVLWLFWSGQQMEHAASREAKLPMLLLHNSIGVILIVTAVSRTVLRLVNGMPPRPEGFIAFRVLSTLVPWALILTILVIIITGVLTWWAAGQPISFFGLFEIASPLARNIDFHHQTEVIHSIASHLIIPIIILHLLGALKHLIIDRDNIFMRMIKPQRPQEKH